MPITLELIQDLQQLNPWLMDPSVKINSGEGYIPRLQQNMLMDPEWDDFWSILVGPRRAGKTTLGFYLSQQLILEKRFSQLLYLNCDFASIRREFTSATLIPQLLAEFKLVKPILFIDEVQRLENPGLTLKSIIDLKHPIKLIASGSSQLEIKSKVQEYLTGREFEAIVLPLSRQELSNRFSLEEHMIFGSYPRVILSTHKQQVLAQLYKRYIEKDIIEILKLSRPDVFERLIILIAHSSGQLVNYQSLASDCGVSIPTIKSYLSLLEKTYVIEKVTPFVGNKRSEITSNPIYYFIDNGFRNQALRNFNPPHLRGDLGLLIQGLVFQEILKYKRQHFLDFDIHFWRTKAQAEVDFILYKNKKCFLPIEVKYSGMQKAKLTRSYRSFVDAYKPQNGIVITQSLIAKEIVDECTVHFVPLAQTEKIFEIIKSALEL